MTECDRAAMVSTWQAQAVDAARGNESTVQAEPCQQAAALGTVAVEIEPGSAHALTTDQGDTVSRRIGCGGELPAQQADIGLREEQ
ncbi:hypothetical protein D3C81_1902500 [compost metagenome]